MTLYSTSPFTSEIPDLWTPYVVQAALSLALASDRMTGIYHIWPLDFAIYTTETTSQGITILCSLEQAVSLDLALVS